MDWDAIDQFLAAHPPPTQYASPATGGSKESWAAMSEVVARLDDKELAEEAFKEFDKLSKATDLTPAALAYLQTDLLDAVGELNKSGPTAQDGRARLRGFVAQLRFAAISNAPHRQTTKKESSS